MPLGIIFYVFFWSLKKERRYGKNIRNTDQSHFA